MARPLEIEPQLLHKAYGLTAAESRVAVLLLRLGSAQDVAQELGTSQHTVRTQIKQIYAKLGVDSRAGFVRLLMALAGQCA